MLLRHSAEVYWTQLNSINNQQQFFLQTLTYHVPLVYSLFLLFKHILHLQSFSFCFRKIKSSICLIRNPFCLLIVDLIWRSCEIKAQRMAPHGDFHPNSCGFSPTLIHNHIGKGYTVNLCFWDSQNTHLPARIWRWGDYVIQLTVFIDLKF